jgi:hypothetical protein
MRSFFLISTTFLLSTLPSWAISQSDLSLGTPAGSILTAKSGTTGVVMILTLIQSFLLKVVLPLVIIGGSLYIAYELFLAEGDESKMKRAYKSIAYSAIALISIALSYAIVTVIYKLSI